MENNFKEIEKYLQSFRLQLDIFADPLLSLN